MQSVAFKQKKEAAEKRQKKQVRDDSLTIEKTPRIFECDKIPFSSFLQISRVYCIDPKMNVCA